MKYALVRSRRVPTDIPKRTKTRRAGSVDGLPDFRCVFWPDDSPVFGVWVFSAFFFFIAILCLLLFPAGNTQTGLFRIEKIHHGHTSSAPDTPYRRKWRREQSQLPFVIGFPIRCFPARPGEFLPLHRPGNGSMFRSLDLSSSPVRGFVHAGFGLMDQIWRFQALLNFFYLFLVDPVRSDHRVLLQEDLFRSVHSLHHYVIS